MADYKLILGSLATIISIGSYLVYLRGITAGRTKPHAFTWFVWGTINLVGFAAVRNAGGGSGAWILAVNIVACYTIALIGFRQGRVHYDRFDYLALAGALIGMILWQLTDQPLAAVILVSLADLIAYIPSFRKAFGYPWEESALSFALGVLNYAVALFALESYTLSTWFYHATIIAADGAFVMLLLVRRRQLAKSRLT